MGTAHRDPEPAPDAPAHPLTSFEQGHADAVRGITANLYGFDDPRREGWDEGHDFAFEQGLAPHPRFGRLTHGKKRAR